MRQRILLIILGVVILLAIYTFFIKRGSRTPKTIARARTKTQEKLSAVKEKIESETQLKQITKVIKEPVKSITSAVTLKPESVPLEPEIEKGKWGTDPFVRDWVLGVEISNLKLKAITQSGTKAYALINDQILETGEVIQGKRIVAIEKEKVTLEQGGRMFTLLLGQ